MAGVALGLRPHWRLALVTVAATVPGLAYVALQPMLYRAIVDDAILAGDWSHLLVLVASLLGLVVVTLASDAAKDALTARLATAVLNDWRASLFDHLQRLSLDFYARARAGDLLTRYSNDLEVLDTALTTTLPSLIIAAIASAISIVLMFSTEWRIALPCVLIIVAMTYIPRVLGPRADAASYQRQQDVAELASTVQEIVGAQPVVKAFGLQPHARSQVMTQLGAIYRSSVRFGAVSGLLRSSVIGGGNGMNAIAIGFGAYFVIGQHMTLGSLLAFIDLAWYLAAYISQLADASRPFQQAVTANRRVQELLVEVPRVVDADGARVVPPFRDEIRFENVTFGYVDDRKTLDGLSFTLEKGASVAVVGPSGCGKSTVLSLLLRFYDPGSGRVLVDGVDLKAAQLASWQAQIGTVFQESYLFNVSIRENIRLGRIGATDAEIEAAATAAEVLQFAAGLPQGLDTVVGERGSRLSGGQRQRVAIARALVRDPSILVLDEPTSALDTATERSLNDTLMRLARGRTVVAVTHRLAMVAEMDRILVLNDGALVDAGSHAELLAREGPYATLWRKQTGFALDEDGARVHVDAEALRTIPLFADLDDDVLTDLAGRFALETVAEGRTVIYEGDPGDTFYAIVHGRVAIERRDERGVDRRLAVQEDGDFFGEIALLRPVPRVASVTTLSPTVLLSLSRNQFLDVVGAHPDLLAALEREVERRLAPLVRAPDGPIASRSISDRDRPSASDRGARYDDR